MKKHFDHGVQRLHSDGGGEYDGAQISEHSTTTPDAPQHNPFAERVNQTFLDPVRAMLEQSGLSAKYWEYAIAYAVYIRNRMLHSALKMSPMEKLTGKKPDLPYARPFGCSAFI